MAKAEKTKLPKELGGFKLSKAIRRAEPIEELMSTSEGRALLSEAVHAGLDAARTVFRREPSPLAAGDDPEPRQARADAARRVADTLDGVMSAWTGALGPAAAAEADRPARKPSRRSTKPAEQAVADPSPAPSRRRGRAARPAPKAEAAGS